MKIHQKIHRSNNQRYLIDFPLNYVNSKAEKWNRNNYEERWEEQCNKTNALSSWRELSTKIIQ